MTEREEQRRYTFKLYPNADQEQLLLKQCSMVADLWNAMLSMQEQRFAAVAGQKHVTHRPDEKSFLSYFDLTSQATLLRQSDPEWEALSVWTPHRTARALVESFQAFFRRAKQGAGKQAGYPKYKSYYRGQHNWLPHRFASGCKMEQVNKRTWDLRIKGIDTPILCKGKFPSDPVKYTDADIRYRAGAWWFSVGTEMPSRRTAGFDEYVIRLDCLDTFAEINGDPVSLADVGLDFDFADDLATIQQAMAAVERRSEHYHSLRLQKSRIEAKAARKRKEALHVWTTALTESAAKLTIIAPDNVKDATESGHGDAKSWGGAVALKAAFNKRILTQSPATALQMFQYKAQEADIPLTVIKHNDLDVGNLAVMNRIAARSVQVALKRAAGL